MTETADPVLATLRVELDLACLDLARARSAQRIKDSLVERSSVAACRDRVDALLDMWNAIGARSSGLDVTCDAATMR
jgi:hypothetical protein